MAKRVRKADLENLIKSALKSAIQLEHCSWFDIDIDSISATIKIIDDSIADKLLTTGMVHYDCSPYSILKEYLENRTGENLKPKIVKKENTIIIQVNYDIIE